MEIKSADVMKLRKMTSAGIMDCKNALTEAKGEFEEASLILRKKGQAIQVKRGDKEAFEGIVISHIGDNANKGAIICLKCETDFVAKTEGFTHLAHNICTVGLDANAEKVDIPNLILDNKRTVSESISDLAATLGEKIELEEYITLDAKHVISYIHPGNKIVTLVGFNTNINLHDGLEVAMQVAAMSPISITKESVPTSIIEKELEIGKAKAAAEGKPEKLLEKIAHGRLAKFFKEAVLMEQTSIRDPKDQIKDVVARMSKIAGKTVIITSFKRFSIG